LYLIELNARYMDIMNPKKAKADSHCIMASDERYYWINWNLEQLSRARNLFAKNLFAKT